MPIQSRESGNAQRERRRNETLTRELIPMRLDRRRAILSRYRLFYLQSSRELVAAYTARVCSPRLPRAFADNI